MVESARKRLSNPFDAYELWLLQQITDANRCASEWAAKSQNEEASDVIALHAYVEHMAALARSRVYSNSLWQYRIQKRVVAGTIP
jgi:hypothetical protein